MAHKTPGRFTSLSAAVLLCLASCAQEAGEHQWRDPNCAALDPAALVCPDGATPFYHEDAESTCADGEQNVLYETPTGRNHYVCVQADACVFPCSYGDPCDCGNPALVGPGLFVCPECGPSNVCGDGICGRPRGQTEAYSCSVDCEARCTEYERCYDGHVESCAVDGIWNGYTCGDSRRCVTGTYNGSLRAVCLAPEPELAVDTPHYAEPQNNTANSLLLTAGEPVATVDCVDSGPTALVESRCQVLAITDDAQLLVRDSNGALAMRNPATGESAPVDATSDATIYDLLPVSERVELRATEPPSVRHILRGHVVAMQNLTHDRDDRLISCRLTQLSADGRRVASVCAVGIHQGNWHPQIAVWDANSGELLTVVHATSVADSYDWTALAFSIGNTHLVAAAGEDVVVHELATRAASSTRINRPESMLGPPRVVGAFSPTAPLRYAAISDGVLSVHSSEDSGAAAQWTWQHDEETEVTALSMVWAPDSRTLAIQYDATLHDAGTKTMVALLNAEDGATILQLELPRTPDRLIRFSPRGNALRFGDRIYVAE